MSPKHNGSEIRDLATGQLRSAHPRSGRPERVPKPKNNRLEIRNPVTGHFNGAHPKAGRKPGTPNKTTTILKEAILVAAANCGDFLAQQRMQQALEDNGELLEANGGLVGFLEYVAMHETKSFVPLLGKVLPLVINGSIEDTRKAEVEARAERFTQQMRALIERADKSGRTN